MVFVQCFPPRLLPNVLALFIDFARNVDLEASLRKFKIILLLPECDLLVLSLAKFFLTGSRLIAKLTKFYRNILARLSLRFRGDPAQLRGKFVLHSQLNLFLFLGERLLLSLEIRRR